MPVVEERVTNLEEIFARFLENSEKRYIQNDIRMRKFDEDMKKMKADSDLRMKKSDEKMDKFIQEMRQMKADHDEEMRQMKADHDEEMKQIKNDSEKKYQKLIQKFGTFLEDIVAPNIPRIAKRIFQAGESTFFAIRAKVKNTNGETREFDAVYVSKTIFLLNESKSNPKIEYINDFIEAIKNIYDYFPMYKDKIFVPIFSSFHIPDNVKKYLTKNKIYGMQIKDDTMEIMNYDELKEK